MKYTIFLMALISVSCGKMKTSGTAGVGGVRELSPLAITTSDGVIFDRICSALLAKDTKLKSSLPNSLVFDVVEKDCDGDTVTFNSQQVRVEASGLGYQFRRQDTNGLFLYPNVETPNAGFMKEICEGTASSLPYNRGSAEAVWVSTGGFNSTECPNAGNEQCLVVEYGTKQGTSNTYIIHTVEYVRFNLLSTSGKYGYFTHRKSLATNNCDQGENTESEAKLR